MLFSASATCAEPCTDLLNYKMSKLRSSEQLDFCQAFQGKIILAVNSEAVFSFFFIQDPGVLHLCGIG
jgi:hypothetical protein